MINIKDNIHTLTADQVQALQTKALAYPFDIYVLIGSSSKAQLQADVSSVVTGPKVLSIGVDPDHRFTFVRGSVDLHLPDGPEVASTGNAFFKRADLVGGIDAIAAKSKLLASTTQYVESATGAPIIVHKDPMASGWWWGLGGIGAVIAVVSVWVWLSRRADRKQLEAERARYSGLNAELNNELGDVKLTKAELGDEIVARPHKRWAPPPSSAPMYVAPPVVVQDDGFVQGLLLGEILSQPQVMVETPVVVAPSVSYSNYSEPSSSSSSWSETSSSSSYDSGSSSDYGSGGGDSGGGGGGSDW